MAVDSPNSSTRINPVNRRTLTVWSILIASMTLASALLLWLEPAPLAPTGGLALTAFDSDPAGLEAIFSTDPPVQPHHWTRIIIHHSGQSRGDAQSIGQLHQTLDYGGLGYHFVIGNGDGAEDGLIQVGYRWMRQIDGVYAPAAVSICLVGNGDQVPPTRAQMDQLVRLIAALQSHLGIGSDQVCLHSEIAQTTSPGRLFPASRLRSQLLSVSMR